MGINTEIFIFPGCMIGDKKMVSLDLLPTIPQLLKLYQVRAKRELSQNFLLRREINDRIARALPTGERQLWIEIGPGPGCLTRSLIQASKSGTGPYILAIEKDDRMEPILDQLTQISSGRFQYLIGDALNILDEKNVGIIQKSCEKYFPDLGGWPPKHIQLVGNLPFRISTILFVKLLRDLSSGWLSDPETQVTLTFMFQKEVAERIAAPLESNDKEIGRMTFLSRFIGEPKILFHVPGNEFFPEPKVDAAMVQLSKHMKRQELGTFDFLEEACKILFSQRNKKIRNIIEKLPKGSDILGRINSSSLAFLPSSLLPHHGPNEPVSILDLRASNISLGNMIQLSKIIKGG